MKKYSVDKKAAANFKDSGSIDYIDDTTDDEGINEGEMNRLVEKQQVRDKLMISYQQVRGCNDLMILYRGDFLSWLILE